MISAAISSGSTTRTAPMCFMANWNIAALGALTITSMQPCAYRKSQERHHAGGYERWQIIEWELFGLR